MWRKYFKNLITLLIITSFVLTPFFGIYSQAQAQPETSGGYETGADYGGGLNGGISGYLTGLAPAITQLPLCKGKLKGVMQDIFVKGGSAAVSATKEAAAKAAQQKAAYKEYTSKLGPDDTIETEDEFTRKQEEATNKTTSVAVNSETANKNAEKGNKTSSEIKEIEKRQEENDTCLKNIGRLVIKMMLQKITLSTVAWIQGGYQGKPAFIQDPGQFFGDIAKNEIIQFGLEIDDPTLYPFGKAFMRSQVQAFNTKFAQNAQYSLNELIQNTTPQYSSETFQKDFSQGGWSAWTYMTSVPANNPIGFQLMASNELQKRLEGTSMSRANEIRGALTQAAGYLGDERCVEPKGLLKMTREEDLVARGINKSYEDTITLPPLPAPVVGTDPVTGKPIFGVASTTPRVIKNTTLKQPVCEKWEYVTPGQMVATAATNLVNYPSNNLLKADDLNDAMGAILDAVLSRFSSDIMNKGFANFSDEGRDGGFILNSGSSTSSEYNQTKKDFSTSQRKSLWLQNNPDFNIRTDLTQAMIDEQRIYVEKLEDYNNEVIDLVKNIYQLDFCIPGPNPLWKGKAIDRLGEIEKEIPNTAGGQIEIIKGLFIMLKAITIQVQPLGIGASLNVGGLAEGILTMLANGLPEDVMTRFYYATILRYNTGLKIAPSHQTQSKGDIVNIIGGVINAYDKTLGKTFTKERMPKVTNQAKAEYLKIEGYEEIIQNNIEEIASRKSVVTKLANIKNEIDALSSNEKENLNSTSSIMASFARLSTNLVSGDDIAKMDTLYWQASDKKDYIYNDLLTGDGKTTLLGCEKDPNARLGANLKALENERRLYPEEIFTPLPGHEYGLKQSQAPICKDKEVLVGDECVSEQYSVPECKSSEILVNNSCINPGSINQNVYNSSDEADEDETQLDAWLENSNEPSIPTPTCSSSQILIENKCVNPTTTITEGILSYGYYFSSRLNPKDSREEQTVVIPKGTLDVNQRCALLNFGPSVKNGAKRTLKSQIKSCKKTYNGSEKNACIDTAYKDNVKMKLEAGIAQNEMNKMCDFQKPGAYRDSIKFFEKHMRIY